MSDTRTHFDDYAQSYRDVLEQALSVSGEGPDFYASGRVQFFARCLQELNVNPVEVLDYGCGTGNEVPLLAELTGAHHLIGLDVSGESLRIAKEKYGSARAEFCRVSEYRPSGRLDAAYCNGVFHHIPADEQVPALKLIAASLRPGAVFGFFENNPWNPGTRYIMSRCAFDGDAVMIWPRTASRLLRAAGFEILRMDFLFVFPKSLKALRRLEPALASLPLGAQYQVLCRRPAE